MTLSELSIKRPVMAWMLMAALIIFGGISALRMGVSQLPDVDYPIITVTCALNGAAPEVMETEEADVVEGESVDRQRLRVEVGTVCLSQEKIFPTLCQPCRPHRILDGAVVRPATILPRRANCWVHHSRQHRDS